MQIFVTILVAGILTDNFVLSQFLGICPFLGVSKKLDTAVGMSLAVTFVMVLATLVTYPLYASVLVPMGLDYLQTIVFILTIAALVQLVEVVMKRYMTPLYNALGIYLPLITTNCAVLGVTILNFSKNYSFVQSMVNSFAAGIGFLVAMVIFAGVRGRLEGNDIPESLKGLPITVISAAIGSFWFVGFSGLGERILQ
jgi:electron transport complex protein RnfA